MNSLRYNQVGSTLALTAVVALGANACSDAHNNSSKQNEPAIENAAPCSTETANDCYLPGNAQLFTKTARDTFLIKSTLARNADDFITTPLEQGEQVQIDCVVRDPGAKLTDGLRTEYHIAAPAAYAGYFATARMLEGTTGGPLLPADTSIPDCVSLVA